MGMALIMVSMDARLGFSVTNAIRAAVEHLRGEQVVSLLDRLLTRITRRTSRGISLASFGVYCATW